MLGVLILVFIIVAGVLAVVDEFRAKGQNLTAWAVVSICVALLLWRLA